MPDVEQHQMPSGESVWYRDSDHQYSDSPEFKRSGRIAGVSTVSKNDGQTNIDGLLDWAARLTCEGVATISALNEDPLPLLRDGYTLGTALKEAKATWRDLRNAKGDAGTAAHKVLEHLAQHDEVPAFSGGHQMAVIDWWMKTRPEVISQEQVVYDHERKFAGRDDLLHNHNAPVLLDLKTGSVREAAMVQLNLYRLGRRAAGLPIPERLVILDTRDDGSWKEIEVPIRPEWALAALEMHRAGADMRRTLNAAKKTARRGQAETERAVAA